MWCRPLYPFKKTVLSLPSAMTHVVCDPAWLWRHFCNTLRMQQHEWGCWTRSQNLVTCISLNLLRYEVYFGNKFKWVGTASGNLKQDECWKSCPPMSTFIYYRSPIEFLHFMHNRPVVKTGKNQENMVKKSITQKPLSIKLLCFLRNRPV